MTMKNPFLLNAQQGKNSFFRYFLTLLVLCFLVIITAVVLSFMAIFYTGSMDIYNYPPLLLFMINMLIFPVALFALWLGVNVFHRKKFSTLITAEQSINWSRFFLAASLWFVLNIISDAFQGLVVSPGNYQWNFSLAEYLPFALLALCLIPVQSATEELLFRGYLMQGFSSLTRSSIAAVILSSLLFASLHMANPEISAYGAGIMLVYYLSMALFLAFVTLRFQGLETAMGLHISNNLYGVLCVSIPDSALPAPAIFRLVHYDSISGLISFLITAVVFFIVFNNFDGRRKKKNNVIIEAEEFSV